MEKSPHGKGKNGEKEQRTGGNGKVADVDRQEICQNLVIKPFQRNGSAEALAGKSPDHCGAVIREKQPHHAHEGDRGEAHISGDHHFSAFDFIQQPTVGCAEDNGKRRCNDDGHHKTHGAGETELNRDGSSQQPGDNSQRETEVQPTAGMDHRYHSQNQNGIPAKTVENVGDLGQKVCTDKRCRYKQQKQKGCNNQPRQSEGGDAFPKPFPKGFGL